MESAGRTIGAAHPGKGRRGTVMVLALVISILMVLTLAAAIRATNAHSRHSQFTFDRTGALSLAEGVTETAQKRMLNEVANFRPPTLSGTVVIKLVSYPYTIVAVGTPVTRTDPDGITLSIQTYRISSKVDHGPATATVSRLVDLTMTPIFQYTIFYHDDLEMLPGANMNLGGRVHSNGDIYVSCGGTLSVNSEYFRCTGDILRKRKDDGSEGIGTVEFKVTGSPDFEAMAPSEDSENPNWIDLALSTWNGTVQSGAHGVKEVLAPSIASIKAFDPLTSQKGYFHANADLVVVDQQAFDRSGNPVPLPPGTITEKSMYDAREGKTVTVTEINVGLLNGSGGFPANGLIYAYRTDASPAQPNGIRLTNASQLLKPMTLVSEDPVYVKGDFNTVNKKGAAVISDAVSLLSKSWNDTKTAGTLPTAAATQYNVAIVTGIVPTPEGGPSYSGGFENLPRFHENWTGVTAKIRGAFINMFDSEMAKSTWAYGGDRYTAPIRDWAYDPALNDVNNMPPFTPNAVYFRRVLWDDGMPKPFQ